MPLSHAIQRDSKMPYINLIHMLMAFIQMGASCSMDGLFPILPLHRAYAVEWNKLDNKYILVSILWASHATLNVQKETKEICSNHDQSSATRTTEGIAFGHTLLISPNEDYPPSYAMVTGSVSGKLKILRSSAGVLPCRCKLSSAIQSIIESGLMFM